MMDVLSPALLKKLDRCAIQARRMYPGASMGERVSAARGQGMEFADYREYSRGDDFRNIDWRIYARLNQLVVRTFETEENLPVSILLDCSASMDFGGEGRLRKWELAASLAAALGYVAMAQRDQLVLHPFADELQERFDAAQGRGSMSALLERLEALQPSGCSHFATPLRKAANLLAPGICFIISDFCATEDLGEALRALVFNGHEVTALHLWDPLEASPGLEGEVDLEDAETGEVLSLTVKGDTADRYREVFETRCRAVAQACSRYDTRYLRLSTEQTLEHIVVDRFRREGVVR